MIALKVLLHLLVLEAAQFKDLRRRLVDSAKNRIPLAAYILEYLHQRQGEHGI